MKKIITILCLSIIMIFSFIGCSSDTNNVEKINKVSSALDGGTWWQPTPGTSWQIQFTGTIDTSLNVQMYDLDMFDTTSTKISELHTQGRKVLCYISSGSWEDWRPDASSFPPEVLGNTLSGYANERWLDIRSPVVRSLMQARMDLALSKSCDGIDWDNMTVFNHDSGFPITAQDQLDYNIWLANETHSRNMAVSLKNDLNQVPDLLPYFDMTINEECFKYNECNKVVPFITAGKPVFQIEYGGQTRADKICPKANTMNFDSLVKKLTLNAFRIACR